MKRLLTSAAIFLSSLFTFAQFSGSGSGTESDPYLILNPIQLNQMRNFLNKEGVYFKLMTDMDLTEFIEDEYPSQGWLPIGNSSFAFKGILDGNGKTLSGLWINRTSSDYLGLFGYTMNATIKNLNIVTANIVGNNYIAILCGYSEGTIITNCEMGGMIKGQSYIGGYVGGACEVTITNCNSSANIEGTGDYVGGFIGSNYFGWFKGYRNNIGYPIKGTITTCRLTNDYIKGNNCVGGLCGEYGVDDNISDCIVYSNISGNACVGGLFGEIHHSYYVSYEYSGNEKRYRIYYKTKVYNSGFVGEIIGNTNVGGIVGNYLNYVKNASYMDILGSNYGNIIANCFVVGPITALNDNVGGIAGFSIAEIQNSYFSGSVDGQNNVGGISGNNSLSIKQSYSNAIVSGIHNVGGISGYSIGNVSACISVNPRISSTKGNIGRIVGCNEGSLGTIGSSSENKSFNKTIVINAGVAQDVNDDEQNGTSVSATTLKLKATYVAMGWDFNNTWEIQETECYPYFKTQTAPPVIMSQVVSGATTISGKCIDGGTVTLETDGMKQQMVSTGNEFSFTVSPLQAGHEVRISAKAQGKEQSYYTTEIVSYLGKGTEADPYQVYTASDLKGVYRKGYFKLMNDVDLTSYINQFSPTEGWQSIGREGSEMIHFDGNGHKITGLWCNSTRENTGLFSCFANGTIKNLIIETAKGNQVKGGANTGILIGKMINGAIENCSVSGTVADGTPVGGLVGLFDGGRISLSQANVTINTTGKKSYVGGLVGEITGGEIDQCVTLGNITATGKESYVGGLVGKNYATVTNCYSNAIVTSTYNAAGLIAYNYGVVDKCYATGNIFSSNYGAGVIGYNDGSNAVVKNSAAMNNKIYVTYESQSAQSGGYGQRIIGGIKNGAPAPELNNYALKNMQVSLNNVSQKVYDDIMNGVGKNGSDLAKASTYQELGWNFSTIWTIVEGESYPSLKNNVALVLQPGEDPVEVDLTAPTAKSGLVYNGSAQELITAGNTNVGTLKYSLDGSNYDTDIPKGTEAKTYTVYYRVVDSENKDLTTAASLIVTISPKAVSSPIITLSETSFVYDGEEKKPTVTVKDGDTTIPASEYTVSYINNVNVGTATVTINDQEGGNYVVSGSAQFTITSATANVTAPQAKSGLVYNGSDQELITAGSSTAGEMQYSLDGSNYSTAIPMGTDAKTYTVYYRVKGDANHSDIAPATLTATISPKAVSSPIITLSETSFVYDGEEKMPTVTVKDGDTTIPASEYTVSYYNNINVGTATVTISDQDGGNYVVSGTSTFEIKEAATSILAPNVISGLIYTGYAQELITPGYTSVGKMLYSLDDINYFTVVPAEKEAKTYTVYYKVTDETETIDLSASASLTVAISKAPLKISVGDYTMTEGDQIPEFELQYDGFKNYETEEVLTKMPSVSCNATANSAPGRYEIIVSGAEAQNYDISYQSGWLTIEIAQGITDIVTDDQPFDVYNTQGRKVRSRVTSLKGLPKGVYIINGIKVMK